MKRFFNYILLLIITTICGFIICVLLFHTPLFRNISVLMYRGCAIIFFVGIMLSFILYFLYRRLVKCGKIFFEPHDILSAVIVFMCIKLTFFVLVPVTVERSVSVFTLSQIEKAEAFTITKDEATHIFLEKYVIDNDAFGKRFDEQIVTGSIKENPDGSYTLTKRGHFLVDFFKIIGRLYDADMKNID